MKKEEKISCHVCKKIIPKAAALHAEGEGYVLHFCNIECLNYWKEKQKKKKDKKESP
jgi:YHS domain-containing protein